MLTNLKNAQTMDELKREYFRLVKLYHPDIHPKIDRRVIQDINGCFDEMKHKLKDHTGTEKKQAGQVENADAFRYVVEQLIHIEGLVIEACGWFIYISGNTQPNKDAIKALRIEGMSWPKWSGNAEKGWVIKPSWYYNKNNGKTWDMGKIRTAYGSHREETKGRVKMKA